MRFIPAMATDTKMKLLKTLLTLVLSEQCLCLRQTDLQEPASRQLPTGERAQCHKQATSPNSKTSTLPESWLSACSVNLGADRGLR